MYQLILFCILIPLSWSQTLEKQFSDSLESIVKEQKLTEKQVQVKNLKAFLTQHIENPNTIYGLTYYSMKPLFKALENKTSLTPEECKQLDQNIRFADQVKTTKKIPSPQAQNSLKLLQSYCPVLSSSQSK